MTIYFTSDLHFGHPFVARKRNPDSRLDDDALSERADRRIVGIINAHVGKRDELYILGDVSSGSHRSVTQAARMVALLNPPVKRRHLILGNHDARSCTAVFTELWPLFAQVARQGRLYVPDAPDAPEAPAAGEAAEEGVASAGPAVRQLILSHYPWRHLMDGGRVDGQSTNSTSADYAADAPVWTGREDEWLLHGHTHDPRKDDFPGRPGSERMLHIGWDAWHRPVSLDEVLAWMESASAVHGQSAVGRRG